MSEADYIRLERDTLAGSVRRAEVYRVHSTIMLFPFLIALTTFSAALCLQSFLSFTLFFKSYGPVLIYFPIHIRSILTYFFLKAL